MIRQMERRVFRSTLTYNKTLYVLDPVLTELVQNGTVSSEQADGYGLLKDLIQLDVGSRYQKRESYLTCLYFEAYRFKRLTAESINLLMAAMLSEWAEEEGFELSLITAAGHVASSMELSQLHVKLFDQGMDKTVLMMVRSAADLTFYFTLMLRRRFDRLSKDEQWAFIERYLPDYDSRTEVTQNDRMLQVANHELEVLHDMGRELNKDTNGLVLLVDASTFQLWTEAMITKHMKGL